MTETELEQLIADHSRFPQVLHGLIAPEDPTMLREREVEGRWSPLEILAHLEEEERRDFRVRARIAAEGRTFEPEMAIDPAGWVIAHGYNEMNPREVLDAFTRERAASIEWLGTLDPAALDRTVEVPKLGTFRCGDFVAAWRVHDLLHARQLSTALAILSARRLGAWKVRYAGGIPTPPAAAQG